jgi:hypothetical protein
MNNWNMTDSIISGITFQELIETLQANEKEINEESVMRTYRNILAANEKDAEYELKANMARIIKELK